MRKLLLLSPALLSACATTPPAEIPVVGGSGSPCVVGPGQAFVGQTATAETGAAILAATRSSVLRWARPGMMMTMEFRADRVTVRYGSDMKIEAVTCG